MTIPFETVYAESVTWLRSVIRVSYQNLPEEQKEDLLQSTFTKALEMVRKGKAKFESLPSTRKYLKLIAKSLYINDYRRANRCVHVDLTGVNESGETIDQDKMIDMELSMRVANKRDDDFAGRLQVLVEQANLCQEFRETLELLCLGYNYREIADRLHITVGTVMSRLHRSKTQIRDAVDGKRGRTKHPKRSRKKPAEAIPSVVAPETPRERPPKPKRIVESHHEAPADTHRSREMNPSIVRNVRLTELFDPNQAYKYDWYQRSNTLWIGGFLTADESEYAVTIHYQRREPGSQEAIWDISFSRENEAEGAVFGVTGSGDQFRIFTTVVVMVQEFIQAKNPDTIRFTADEPSRQKLYRALAQRFLVPAGFQVTVSATSKGAMVFNAFNTRKA